MSRHSDAVDIEVNAWLIVALVVAVIVALLRALIGG